MIIYGSSDPGALLFIKENIISKSKHKFRKINNALLLKKNINNAKVLAVLTGSALGNSIDKKLCKWALKNNILSISIIDHWINFDKRFLLSNKKIFPDYIFVNDKYAKNLAIKQGLPRSKIVIFGNNYLYNLFKKNKKFIHRKHLNKVRKKILFISEPITEDAFKIGNKIINSEFKCLDLIIKHAPIDWETCVKLHPREKQSKYKNYRNISKFVKGKNIIRLVNNYEIIIGINSMLLVEIGLIRNNVFSLKLNSKKNLKLSQLKIIDQINNIHNLKKIFFKKNKIKNNSAAKVNSFKQKIKFDNLIKKLKRND